MHLWDRIREQVRSRRAACTTCLRRLEAKSKAPSGCVAGMKEGVGGIRMKLQLFCGSGAGRELR